MTTLTVPNKVLTYKTRIDIPEAQRSQLILHLNSALASLFDLKSQVKQAHWNVKGPQFIALHELFDDMATELEDAIDTTAERVTALGGYALGTARMAVAASALAEYPLDLKQGLDHVSALADRYATVGQLIRDAIDQTTDLGDADTADLFTGLSRDLDKRLWFLEAHLQTQ